MGSKKAKELGKGKPPKERVFRGIPASPGIAIGKIHLIEGDLVEVTEESIPEEEIGQEIERLRGALNKTRAELLAIKKRVVNRIGEESAKVFDAHLMILEDKIILEEAIRRIRQEKKKADWVYFRIMREFHNSLLTSGDEYMRERGLDVLDVKRRVLRNMREQIPEHTRPPSEPVVIATHQMTPSQTVALDKRRILGFATDIGGRTSHVAILARALEKPAVVGLKDFSRYVEDGYLAILDGNAGLVILNPQKETLRRYQELQEKYNRFLQDLIPLRDLPSRTLDGREIELSANIEFPDEVDSVLAYGAKGIGLYRTEYLYLAKKDFPSEEEQLREYTRVAEKIHPNSVIIRTFDLGGDRVLINGFPLKEANPFLGWRAIRMCLDLKDIFRAQLRAILRASALYNIKIMFPMITSLEEFLQVKQILEEVKEELRRENVPFDEDIAVGIMVEVPSAALSAEVLAKEVNFMSIGTNDLIQYTLAVDRGNARIASLYRAFHPAVLKLIQQTVNAGHQHGIWVGMCGEMASDPLALPLLLGLGLDELSVTPHVLPEVKRLIRSLRFDESKDIAQQALSLDTADAIEKLLKSYVKEKVEHIPALDHLNKI